MITGTMKKQKVAEEDREEDTERKALEILVTGSIKKEGGEGEDKEVEAWTMMMMVT